MNVNNIILSRGIYHITLYGTSVKDPESPPARTASSFTKVSALNATIIIPRSILPGKDTIALLIPSPSIIPG